MVAAAAALRPDARPATVAMAFFDALNAGDPSFARLIDFGEFHRANAPAVGGCSVKELRQKFERSVRLPLKHRQVPGRGSLVKNQYVVIESEDHVDASVDLIFSSSVGSPDVKVNFRLVHGEAGWRVTNMHGWFEDQIFEACAKR